MAPTSLEGLPVELLHLIVGYLVGPLCSSSESTGLDWAGPAPRNRDGYKTILHPLNQLAAVSHLMDATVEDVCRRLCMQQEELWKVSTGGSNWPAGKLEASRAKACRRTWLQWARRHCAFCSGTTVRRAIFNNHILCCKKCDQINFPEKMTMTEAMKRFDLRREHLFGCAVYKVGSWEYSKPRIRCASYDCQGVLTRLFFRADVVKLAHQVHGDFDAHMKVREERKRKLADRKRQKRAANR